MPKRPLTNKDGEVRPLTADDFKHFRPIGEVDPGMIEAAEQFRGPGPSGHGRRPETAYRPPARRRCGQRHPRHRQRLQRPRREGAARGTVRGSCDLSGSGVALPVLQRGRLCDGLDFGPLWGRKTNTGGLSFVRRSPEFRTHPFVPLWFVRPYARFEASNEGSAHSYLFPQGQGRLLRSQYLLENSPYSFLTVNDV